MWPSKSHDLAHAVARQLVRDVADQTNENSGAGAGRPWGMIAVSRFRLGFVAVGNGGRDEAGYVSGHGFGHRAR